MRFIQSTCEPHPKETVGFPNAGPANLAVEQSNASALLVFADDWGRHPSSCQHLISQLLPRYRVTWINTIGMRTPRWNWSTVTRAAGKIRGWCKAERAEREELSGPAVISPRMWPWFTRSIDRKLNRILLSRALKRQLSTDPGPTVAITTLPIAADLVGELPVDHWVYYCVDDFSQWPGLDGNTLLRMERDLVARTDRIVAASRVLQTRIEAMGRTASLLTHGVDLEHWRGATGLPSGVADFERPLVLFWGLLDPRMDAELLRRLGEDLQAGTILLVGPGADEQHLVDLPRVRRMPAVPYSALPNWAQAADVLVMPYADLPVTRAMQPLKLLEYLATDKPVVVRDLPANSEWGDCLDLVRNAEEFSARVRLRLETGLPASQRAARSRLCHESWAAKAAEFERTALLRA